MIGNLTINYKNIRFTMIKRFALVLLLTAVGLADLSAIDWAPVQQKVHEAIGNGYFAGCVLGVYNQNSTLYTKAFGSITQTYGLYSPPVTLDMHFDANWLTQVLGINSYLMRMYDLTRINVTDKVSRHLFDFDNNGKRTITIENLMLHNSGLQSTYSDAFGNTPADLLKKIDTLKLEYKEESKFSYSELGYVVLGQMIAKMEGKALDTVLFEILVESGMRDTKYKLSVPEYQIVPSGYHGGVTRGKPFNKIANFLGTAGNAGLFTTLDNVGKYMQLMLNKGKQPFSTRIFSEEVINLFTKKVDYKAYKNTRALGWDTVPAENPPCGTKFSQNSFGMSDPSGSYIWADASKNVTIVLLANGQFPAGTKRSPSAMQGQISDAIMTALGY